MLRNKLGTELRFSSAYHSGRPDSSRRVEDLLRSFTRLLSKTTSLAEINNVSQKGYLFDFVSSVDTYEMEAPGAN